MLIGIKLSFALRLVDFQLLAILRCANRQLPTIDEHSQAADPTGRSRRPQPVAVRPTEHFGRRSMHAWQNLLPAFSGSPLPTIEGRLPVGSMKRPAFLKAPIEDFLGYYSAVQLPH